jgi:hypothetical protein
MLEAARQRAYEMVNDSSCLDDKQFKELQVLPEETAVTRLAIDFLDEALEDNDIEEEEPGEIEDEIEDEDEDEDEDEEEEEDEDDGW